MTTLVQNFSANEIWGRWPEIDIFGPRSHDPTTLSINNFEKSLKFAYFIKYCLEMIHSNNNVYLNLLESAFISHRLGSINVYCVHKNKFVPYYVSAGSTYRSKPAPPSTCISKEKSLF